MGFQEFAWKVGWVGQHLRDWSGGAGPLTYHLPPTPTVLQKLIGGLAIKIPTEPTQLACQPPLHQHLQVGGHCSQGPGPLAQLRRPPTLLLLGAVLTFK